MATQLSTKVSLCTHFSVYGYWMKQCVSCLKYYFTLSLPFEQRLVFRLCCDVQIVVWIIIGMQYRFFSYNFFFWHLVINGQFMLIMQIPGLGRQWFDDLFQMSSLTIRDMMLCTLLSNLLWKLSTVLVIAIPIVTKRLSNVLSWVWPKLATPTVAPLDFLITFFVSFLVFPLAVEEDHMSRDVRVSGKQVNTKAPTFLWQSRGSRPSSSTGEQLEDWSAEGCCIRMLKFFYTVPNFWVRCISPRTIMWKCFAAMIYLYKNNNCGSINPFFKEHLFKCIKKKQLY